MNTTNATKLPSTYGQSSNTSTYAQTHTTSSGFNIPDVVTLRDGKPDCYCGKPADTLTSHTQKNPDRVFYRCPDRDDCAKPMQQEVWPQNRPWQYFQWDDDLRNSGILPRK